MDSFFIFSSTSGHIRYNIDWVSWKIPNIFKVIQESGNITDDEMRKVFNLGIGLIAIIDKNNLTSVKESISSLGEEVIEIGEIE